VKKISSFGIREWVDFITALGKQVSRILLIECTPKVVDQLNMVANFAGGGTVFSFYVPFRCDFCDSEHRILLQLDRDFDAIKSMKIAERACPSCQEQMYFDEDGATFFSYMLSQGPCELESSVLHFLAAKLNYAVNEVGRKFKVDKQLDGQTTYLRVHGDLDQTFPKTKLADGIEGTVVVDLLGLGRIEPAGAALWRSFVGMVTPLVKDLYLLGVPSSFVEKLCSQDDLGSKTQVLSISLPYSCQGCGGSGGQWIDVATHHSVLRLATAPDIKCIHCKSALSCVAGEALMTALASLPQPTASVEQLKHIKAIRERKPVARPGPSAPSTAAGSSLVVARQSWWVPLTAAMLAVILAGAGYFGYQTLVSRETSTASLGKPAAASDAQRPSWASSQFQGSVTCDQGSTAIVCFGVSSISLSKEDALDEAGDAALEGVGNALAMQIVNVEWQAALPPIWQATRVAKMAAFDRDPSNTLARREVRLARQAVAQLMRTTAGAIVPMVPSATYWEQYQSSGVARYLAFVQFTLPASNAAALVSRYQQTGRALGATVVTAFPQLGWRYPTLAAGVVVVAVADGRLKNRGLTTGYLLLDVAGRVVSDAPSFEKLIGQEMQRLELVGGNLELTVQAGDIEPRTFQDSVEKKTRLPLPNAGRGNGDGGRNAGNSNVNVNVWDRVGGGSAGERDDPNQ
jgi:hypothetical protein